MELQDYLAIIRKRWISIVLITVLATGGALAATLLTTPIYSARAQVFVSVRAAETTSDLVQGSSFTQRQVKSYTDLVTSPRVLGSVIENLGLDTTPDQLAASITADSPLDTVLINITTLNPDPQTASDIANSVAFSLSTTVGEIERPVDGISPVKISTVRTASPPTVPTSPNRKTNTALGLLVGLALGLGLAIMREVLDTRIRTVDDIHKITPTSVMTTMTHDDNTGDHRLIVHTDPHSPRAEAFRRLRTNLQFLDVADRLESIVVTSALPGEGKSTVAVNLAITLADAGSSVALVDADLRRPSIAEYMGLEGRVGLTTVLIGQATLEDVIQPWGDGKLSVLPSGQIPPNPSEMIGSHAMAWLLGELVKRYDIVIIDTPPLLPVTDAAILARLTGGAMVVTGANRLHRTELTNALESLDVVGARVLGIVLNHLTRSKAEGYSYKYSYYGTGTERTRKRAPVRTNTAHSSRRRTTARSATGVPHPSEGPDNLDSRTDRERLEAMLATVPQAEPVPTRWTGDPVG